VSDSWRPRPHDHLVEPLFGGLGHQGAPDAGPRRGGWSVPRVLALAVLVSALALAILIVAR
jgi:hypothetical protein